MAKRKYTKNALRNRRAFFLHRVGHLKEAWIDKLFHCASRFQKLFHIQYRIILGRKGVQTELILDFKIHFHHLAGLHKLGDIEFLRSGKRDFDNKNNFLGIIKNNNLKL